MSMATEVTVTPEKGGFANIHCNRCGEHIGRVQTDPPAQSAERAEIWEAKVRGEIEVMAKEHELLCSAGPPRPRKDDI